MATESVATTTRPADVGLKREMGLIGATWASETSIIGSGWLFAPLTAALLIGGAAVLDWVIAGVVVIVLALCHAELGAMYPVSGGTARFPHFAFGSVAGIGFGFFSYVQAVTIAPIECYAFIQYASYYWHGLFNTTTGKITGLGLVMTIILMAIFTAVNFLAMRIFARVNSTITWWKVAIPVLAIIVLLFKFHPANFTAGGAGFMPGGVHGLFAALPLAGIIFAYSGFEQADQLAGEIKNPGRNLPRAIIIAVLIGTVIYTLLQVAFIGAIPPDQIPHGLQHITNPLIIEGPFAGVAALAGFAWLAHILRIDAFISPSGTGLIYTTGTSRVSYGLARNRYAPQFFSQDQRHRHSVGRADLRVPVRAALPAAVPELALAGRHHHRRERADVRGRAAVPGCLPRAGAGRKPAVPHAMGDGARPGRVRRRRPAHLLVGLQVVWKLGIVLVIGYVLIGISMAFDQNRPPLDWKSAVWLPVWLLGMGVISWQGQFPVPSTPPAKAPTNTFNIPFWWDIVVVAVFSLIIYYWAMATKLPREEMLNLVGRQAGEEPPERNPH